MCVSMDNKGDVYTEDLFLFLNYSVISCGWLLLVRRWE